LHAAEVQAHGSIGAVLCKSLLRLYVRPGCSTATHDGSRGSSVRTLPLSGSNGAGIRHRTFLREGVCGARASTQ
jgi:hypothetical protein